MKRGGEKSRPFAKLLRERFYFFMIFFFAGAALCLYPEDSSGGDAAMAERYAQWAQDSIDRGQWKEALAGLERASDFAGVSSDISYLLALARSHENKPRGLILEALNHALAVGRWNKYNSREARLFKAETLIAVRAYSEALDELSRTARSPREAVLTLKALNASGHWEFREVMSATLDRYPRESGPVRIFFSFLKREAAAGRAPEKEDLELLELIVRRLPVLLSTDPELAWMAAPFMRDSAEAKRLVQAYRAARDPAPDSLPAALRLGVVGEETAIEELFAFTEEYSPHGNWAAGAKKTLDEALLSEAWELLRNEGSRELFRRNLSAYTGIIIKDEDHDGIPESSAEYSGGALDIFTHDADQDGVPDLSVFFEAGEPRRALTVIPPESSGNAAAAAIVWERYPAVLEAELGGIRYIPRPLNFHYSPVLFDALFGSGLLLPRKDSFSPPLTRRVLVSQALHVERPSLEFSGGRESVELAQGIPVAAREYVGEQTVSETEFIRGRPQIQRADLDLDGRMETVRVFRHGYRTVELEDLWNYDRNIEYTVSDWDGDGIFESGDSYRN